MRHVSSDERRTRLGVRHHLTATVDTVEQIRAPVGRRVLGEAGRRGDKSDGDPATVYLSARARVDGFSISDLESALYDDRSLVRLWGMRRTLFVTTPSLAAIMHAASPDAFGSAERRRLERLLTAQGKAPDAGAWIDRVESKVIDELAARGEATANDLRKVIPEMRETLTFGEGKSWGGTVGVSTRILFMLAAQGRIVRGRPLGSWVSSQYRWALTSRWLDEPLGGMEPAAARAELVRCWLRRFGPGTTTDIKWWTGWTVRDTRDALAMINAVEVDVDDGPGWLLADDLDPVEPASDWVALLPGLDPTVMGWKERNWYLGKHTPERGPDRLVEWPGGRRLGSARERRGCRPPPERRNARRGGGHRGRGAPSG